MNREPNQSVDSKDRHLEPVATRTVQNVRTKTLIAYLRDQFPEFSQEHLSEELTRVCYEAGYHFLSSSDHWTVIKIEDATVTLTVSRKPYEKLKKLSEFQISCSEEIFQERKIREEAEKKLQMEKERYHAKVAREMRKMEINIQIQKQEEARARREKSAQEKAEKQTLKKEKELKRIEKKDEIRSINREYFSKLRDFENSFVNKKRPSKKGRQDRNASDITDIQIETDDLFSD